MSATGTMAGFVLAYLALWTYAAIRRQVRTVARQNEYRELHAMAGRLKQAMEAQRAVDVGNRIMRRSLNVEARRLQESAARVRDQHRGSKR